MLTAGQQGEIDSVLGVVEQTHRLEELGFRPGNLVEMLQSGSPCIVRLQGQKLCFRSDELTCILVRPRGSA